MTSNSDIEKILAAYLIVPQPEEANRSRKPQLQLLEAGDIFHAHAPNGASLICLAVSVEDGRIRARRITSQDYFEFDRETGIQLGEEPLAAIDSIAPLPLEIHNVFLVLDRKGRLQQDEEQSKLSEAEKRALLFAADFYPANPLRP
jgi:hypothetical protein